jgi:nitrate reductase gamma subunit
MEHDLRLTVFWIAHVALLALFGLELLFVLSVWLKARVPGLPMDASRWTKLGVVLGFSLRLIFSRRIWPLLKALVTDGMVHQRLYRTDLRRWASHTAVFGSFLLLGFFSTVTGVVVEILPLLGMSPDEVARIPIIGHLYHADVWWVALANEVLGLMVLAGMVLVIYRRYIQKDAQLRTMPADTLVIVLLAIIAFSGFPAETFRLLADYTTGAGVFAPDPSMLHPDKFPPALHGVWGPQFGFAGYASAWVLGALRLSADAWNVFRNFFFWLHFVVVALLLFLLPFTRFFHVIMSPMIVAYNTTREEERQKERNVDGQSAPQAAG